MSEPFMTRLERELTAAGITGGRRARILEEFADHLACDPQADLGEPGVLARRFADEVGSAQALQSAIVAFTALAVAGLLFAIAFVTSGSGAFGARPLGAPALGRLATGVGLLAPQVAFVAGTLALLRWLRRRHEPVLAAAEARVIVRRAAVGVAFGILSMLALAGIAIAYHRWASSGWVTFSLVAAAVGVLTLLAALRPVLAATRLRPLSEGGAGDIFDDLGRIVPRRLRGHPWWLATLVSVGVAVLIVVAAVPAQDEFDGALRGILDALGCMGGFATLGLYLGLWSPSSRRQTQAR